MVCLKRFDFRLTFAALFFLSLSFGPSLGAGAKDNKYVSSRKPIVKTGAVVKSDRRLSVKGTGSTKLKKTTFWNKKPFQFSTPLVSESMIFIGSDSGVFYGIDANKIKKHWKYEAEGSIQSKAQADGGVVYFGDDKGYAYALSATDGKEIWKSFLEWPIVAEPLLSGDRIFFVTERGSLIALSKADGREIFRTPPIEKAVGFSIKGGSAPVWSGGLILFGTSTGMLLAVRENGNLAWVKQLANRQELVYDLDSKPLIEAGRIFVATADRNVYCLDPNGGNVIWSTSEAGGSNDLTLNAGKLYATGGGVLSSINADDGSIIWQQDFETPEISSPAVSQNIAAVISTHDKFYLVDAETGDILFERYIKKGSFADPVFMGDRLYMISNSGVVISYWVHEKASKPPKKKT